MRVDRWLLVVSMVWGCAESNNPSGSTGGAGGSGEGASGGGAAGGTGGAGGEASGGSGPCLMADECTSVTDACNVGTCINGSCEKVPANEGALCDDGKACTISDTCQTGVCTSANLMFCTSSDICHVGFCNPESDVCEEQPGNDGALCDDDDPCTQTGTCASGACSPGPQIDCSFLNGTCSVGSCDPQIGCVSMPMNDGTPCDDNLFCTVNDICQGGLCSGPPNPCAPPGDVCQIGVCSEAQKTCVSIPGNDGAACNDGNGCTSGELCSAGACVGGMPANNGLACDDGDGCTSGTTCGGGSCGSPTGVVVGCIDNDACCPAGCVLNSDNDCSLTRWSDGTMQWPDQACNPFNSFGNCDTNAQNHADAWATAVCQLNGYSLGVWTGNKQDGCSGDISMYCQGAIPCAPTYENMCAPGDQTIIELTCFP